jgi:hypothetical protein
MGALVECVNGAVRVDVTRVDSSNSERMLDALSAELDRRPLKVVIVAARREEHATRIGLDHALQQRLEADRVPVEVDLVES